MLAHFICISAGIKIGNEIPSMSDLMLKPKEPELVCVDVEQAFSFIKGLKK